MKNNVSQVYGICEEKRFEMLLEEAKRVGLELILKLQNFTMEPSKRSVESVFELVAEYKILSDTIFYTSKDYQVKYFKNLNHSLKKIMETLDLMEVYRNIIRNNKKNISKELKKKKLRG